MGMGWRFRLSPYGDFRPEKAPAGKAPARVFFASRIALSAICGDSEHGERGVFAP